MATIALLSSNHTEAMTPHKLRRVQCTLPNIHCIPSTDDHGNAISSFSFQFMANLLPILQGTTA